MKTNVPISLTDEQRDQLANLFDGKVSKRLLTRADVTAFLQGAVDSALAQVVSDTGARVPLEPRPVSAHPNAIRFSKEIEAGIDRLGCRGTNLERSYRRGWVSQSFGR